MASVVAPSDVAEGEAPNPSPPTTVLYIGGEGRSGSTVLSTILGSYPDMVAIGEFRAVWQSLQDDERCGCGLPVSRCPFWTAVGDRAFGGWPLEVEPFVEADKRFARHQSIPILIWSRCTRETQALRVYRDCLAKLYEAITEVSGCRIVVDSTKRAPYAYLLRDVSGIDLRVVHLVRDSRAVAYSNSKPGVRRPEAAHRPMAKDVFIRTQSISRTAIDWQLKNLLFYFLVSSNKRALVKYETLMADPEPQLLRILQLAGADQEHESSLDMLSRSFEILPLHTLGGNPVRFKRGPTELKLDDEWRRQMKRRQIFAVSLLTFPSLVAYGYVGRRVGNFLSRLNTRPPVS